jgi:nucleotide-binding universal stress UspA family protein
MAGSDGKAPVVVVGVDGSAESVQALQWAAGFGAATGATVDAVIAWHYPSAVGPAPVGVAPESISDEVRHQMTETVRKAITDAAIDSDLVQVQVAYGHPAEVLVGLSAAADLLVVGSRGHGRFTGMLVGSVSLHCVTHAVCPVVVVRRPGHDHGR